MVKKLKKEKKIKEYKAREIKNAVDGVKPLGKPLPNRFLLMLVKNHIKNGIKD